MQGKKILLGITGSIAAYKIPALVRLFVKAGAEVKVVMTPAAADFVSPLVLSTISKNTLSMHLSTNDRWENHVMLGRWADLMLIAPASANTIAKMANGLCDNLLMASYLSATCPVYLAPAMDEDMYHHPSFTQNCERLLAYGNIIIPANHGELASGLIGFGRMAEIEAIFQHVQYALQQTQRLSGKKVLITAGPTYENIDPVRFIGNYSSGKMGLALAMAFASEGAIVTLVIGPSQLKAAHPNIEQINVQSAQQMFEICQQHFTGANIAIMSAAVADYKPKHLATEKIKKGQEAHLTIELEKTIDILKTLGASKRDEQLLIGFALESQDEEAYALKKLKEKNADIIVLNSLRDAEAGFMKDTNKVTLYNKDERKTTYEAKSKRMVAQDILEEVINIINTK